MPTNLAATKVANLLINVKPRFEKNRGLFIVDINRHHNKACKGDCFADLKLRSTAVLREQMSFIHAGDGMNAAISFLFKHLTHSVHLEQPTLLSL